MTKSNGPWKGILCSSPRAEKGKGWGGSRPGRFCYPTVSYVHRALNLTGYRMLVCHYSWHCCEVASVVSDSVRPHGRQPTRLPRPWDSPGMNTGVDCHFLLQCRKVKSKSEVAQSCPTLSNPMDCSPPGSSVHGIFQARVLEWGAMMQKENKMNIIEY